MKSFQQNLLISLALSLCGLCVYQWYGQTHQRAAIQSLNQMVYERAVAIQGYTNSIQTMDRQIAEMDARITTFKAESKTNAELIATQKRELNRLQLILEGQTNEIAQYKAGVATLQGKLKEAYDGIQKQNEALKTLAAQRDELVKKYNDEVKDRNDVVSKYNDLVHQVEKIQSTSSKP